MVQNTTFRRRMGSIFFAAGVIALSGCAAFKPATPEQIVEQRATDYWKARVAGQYDKAYALSTPSYRKAKTAEQFKMQFGAGVAVKSVEVTKVTCDSEKCTTQVKLGVQPGMAGAKLGTIDSYLNETWLLEDGQWWHYQDL
ncbi:nuclear transport factor 2 family protein [Acidovorax sp. SUPP3434]|uniref:hypothetical protein n=1 Tax=Acidovorax sp. SUPP3434 TaxID=2920880 RepID=UPI0023DE66AB|nr:hypothetical protein [Acidovorax sp. SUPP3434]GKS98653.1 nuclear transport factor 2 family protein [Acidovorax sp. SUPP3434]